MMRTTHSSQFHSLCPTKCSSKTLQNLPCYIYTKIHKCFFPFYLCATFFPQSMSTMKKLHKELYAVNFEVFRGNFSLSTKSEFGRTRRSGGRLLCAPSCVTFYHHDHPFLACATEKKSSVGGKNLSLLRMRNDQQQRQSNAASSIHTYSC